MPRYRMLLAVAGLFAVGVAAAVGTRHRGPGTTPPAGGPVKLAVLVVFDQMRGDFVDKWRPYFGPDGFRRVQDNGAWFPDCHYPYASTSTGPGHASMLTGTTLDKSGIIGNDWYDRAAGESVYCAGSDRYQFVPAPKAKPAAAPKADAPKEKEPAEGEADGKKKKPSVGNPDKLLSPTLADSLKAATGGRGKVFGLSLKDRSAILPTGKKPDGAYWFTGQFVTSTYYRDTLPKWVADFNKSGAADKWFGMPWTRSRPDLDYDAIVGKDDVKGEGGGTAAGRSFPHLIGSGKAPPGGEYYNALANSPFGNDLLLDFTKACVTNEKLGRHADPDLLVVSFSSNDLVGHTWGPDSHEVFDTTLRSDRQLADLMRFLDRQVGPGNYALAITADHGVCPLPEVSAAVGRDAKRVTDEWLKTGAETVLTAAYGPPPGGTAAKPGKWVEAISGPWVYLNHRHLAAQKIDVTKAGMTLAGWVRGQPNVSAAFSLAEIENDMLPPTPLAHRVKASTHPDRAGDVCVVLKPYYLQSDPVKGTGTSHGTPHDYDTHVPLMVYGPGLTGGARSESVTPQHAAGILAKFLGVPAPRDNLYDVPATLFGRADEGE